MENKETGNNEQLLKNLEDFGKLWKESLEKRIEAAKLYYKAAGTDLNAKHAFQRLPQFAHWSPAQWRVVYYVGEGSISEKYLDVHPYAVSLEMLAMKVPVDVQERIFDNGLNVVIGNKMRTVPVKNLTAPMVTQAFTIDGEYRTAAQQKEHIKLLDKARNTRNNGKLEYVPGGKWKARTSFIIDKKTITALILDEEHPMLTLKELLSIVAKLEKRG